MIEKKYKKDLTGNQKHNGFVFFFIFGCRSKHRKQKPRKTKIPKTKMLKMACSLNYIRTN